MDETILKRTRSNYSLVQKDDSEENSSSSDSDSDDSYRAPSVKITKKTSRKRTASVYKPPPRKLKSLLAEKTRQLKKNSKKNSFENKIRRDKIVTDKVESNVENLTTAVENKDDTIENEDRTGNEDSPSRKEDSKPAVFSNEVRTIDCVEILDDDDEDVTFIENNPSVPAIKPKFEKSDVDFSNRDTKPEMLVCENEVTSSIRPTVKPTAKSDEIPATVETKMKIISDKKDKILVKEEKPIIKHESVKNEFVEKKNKPIVLTLSTSINSPYITPYFLSADKPSQDSSSSYLPNVPVQMPQSPNISSSTMTHMTPTSSPVSSQSSSTTPSTGVARLRINPNLQASPAFETSLVNNTDPQPQLQQMRGQPQRMRGQRTPRRRGTPRVPGSSSAVSSSSLKPRKLFNCNDIRQVRPSSEPDVEVVSIKTYLPTSTLKGGISLNSISSSGTVLYSDSGSVTITPRKKSPERSSLPKRLIRTDVEGIIVCKEENGIFRYALRLANGKHYPLSDEQIKVLRKQNKGVLPTKLKIPVPSDVASQVEPRFIIED